MEEYHLTRRQAREAGLIYFYQYLIEKDFSTKDKSFFNLARFIDENMNNLNIYLKDKYETDKNIKLVDNELFVLLVAKMNDIDLIIADLDKYLDDKWSFERLSLVEQALLIISYIQIKEQSVDKKIIINEAIEISKQYCDDDSYKFINGVLDAL